MSLEDQFKCLVGAYYGITLLDEYNLKEYLLNDIKNYIKDFVETNEMDKGKCKISSEKYEKELSNITKLQDSLILLNKMNANIDVILLVKKKIKDLKK